MFNRSKFFYSKPKSEIFYSRVFQRQFPNLDVDGKISELLQEYEQSKQQKGRTKEKTTDPEDIPFEFPNDDISDNNKPTVQSGIYSLQSGAYSIHENAEQQKINLII